MIYFDSDMSKSTNTVVYFDWKTVIYIYVVAANKEVTAPRVLTGRVELLTLPA
jgi:hypothetical protein